MVSFSLHLSFPQGRPESGSPFEKFFLRQSTTGYTLQTFSLSAIYRCVARSCHKVIKQNLYQRKFSCIPHLSKYSCLAFSRSSSVDAVLNVVYNWRFTILSNFPSMLFLSPADIPHSQQDGTGTMPVINLLVSAPVIFFPCFSFPWRSWR